MHAIWLRALVIAAALGLTAALAARITPAHRTRRR
jgi:hypothetical protein